MLCGVQSLILYLSDCDGINNAQGQPIKIPCACPPDRATFIAVRSNICCHLSLHTYDFFQDLNANVNAGFATNNPTVKLSFPTDSSQASALARLNAAAVTLQNLNGPGQGCPVVSTTFQAQQAAVNAGQDPNSVQAPAAVAAPPDGATAPAPAAPAPAPAAPAPPANNVAAGTPSQSQIAALAPSLGFQAGVNPTGESYVSSLIRTQV